MTCYRDAALGFMSSIAERLRGTGHPQERVMASAQYLAEHLAEVPAIVIPTIIGRHDGNGRPGLFDSVIQAAWSFCLALRAAGLGTTWVTAVLENEAPVKELLGIPDHLTEIVVLPVAWTKGTEFGRAPRHPARAITYFDRFGTTFERGPGPTLRFEDGPGVIVEIDIAATVSVLWSLISDIEVATRFSTESQGAEWHGTERGLGAQFTGRNRHDLVGEWQLPCTVDVYEELKSFGWCTSNPERPGARWRFDLEPAGSRTRLRFSYTMGPGPSGTRRRSDRTRTRSRGSYAAASTTCRPTCNAPSKGSATSPSHHDDICGETEAERRKCDAAGLLVSYRQPARTVSFNTSAGIDVIDMPEGSGS